MKSVHQYTYFPAPYNPLFTSLHRRCLATRLPYICLNRFQTCKPNRTMTSERAVSYLPTVAWHVNVVNVENCSEANSARNQVCSFLSRTDKQQLNIVWYGKKLQNIEHPEYLALTLDRELPFKHHVQNCKAKVTRWKISSASLSLGSG